MITLCHLNKRLEVYVKSDGARVAQLGVTSNTYKCILALGSNLDYDATKGEGFGLIHLYLSRLCPKISPIRRHACEGRQPPNTGPLLLYKLLLKSDVCIILSLHCSFFLSLLQHTQLALFVQFNSLLVELPCDLLH